MTATESSVGFGTLCVHCFAEVFKGAGFEPSFFDRLDRRGFKNCCHCGDEVYSNIYALVQLDKIGHPEFTRPPRPQAATRRKAKK